MNRTMKPGVRIMDWEEYKKAAGRLRTSMLEWVKVKPKFCEHKYRGRLVEDEEIWYDFEKEFIAGMEKFSIPYEAGDRGYTIYGYR